MWDSRFGIADAGFAIRDKGSVGFGIRDEGFGIHFCFAMTLSLIFAYVACGTIFFVTSSFFTL